MDIISIEQWEKAHAIKNKFQACPKCGNKTHVMDVRAGAQKKERSCVVSLQDAIGTPRYGVTHLFNR